MPTREAIVDTVIPHDVIKPIPVRTISTRIGPKPMTIAGQNTHQVIPDRNNSAEASAIPEESVRLSPQLSALARKEQAYRQREQALKQREKDLEAKLSKADQFEQLQTKISSKDFSQAEELGLNYEEYTNYLLNKQSGEDPQTQAFKKLEDEIAGLKKAQEENAQSQFDETVQAYRTELKKAVEADPKFLKLKKFSDVGPDGKEISGVDVALQFILDSWEEDQESVAVDEALDLTNKFIEERARKWAALIEEPKSEALERELPPPRASSKTLTNQMQPSGETPRPQKSLQHLSESERYAEARRRVLARRQQGM